jgi:hypothetical protein
VAHRSNEDGYIARIELQIISESRLAYVQILFHDDYQGLAFNYPIRGETLLLQGAKEGKHGMWFKQLLPQVNRAFAC